MTLPSNIQWEDRNGYPYFIVTRCDGTTIGTWNRTEAVALAGVHQPEQKSFWEARSRLKSPEEFCADDQIGGDDESVS